MKTPMQELISVIRKRQEDEDVQPFMWLEQIVELAESMLEREKEVMQDFATDYERECRVNLERSIEKCWDETFNTKSKVIALQMINKSKVIALQIKLLQN